MMLYFHNILILKEKKLIIGSYFNFLHLDNNEFRWSKDYFYCIYCTLYCNIIFYFLRLTF